MCLNVAKWVVYKYRYNVEPNGKLKEISEAIFSYTYN